ncbi:hypothetical protein [Paenibacillus sp. YYML68]|uniref:hypothetical protein n=1 Tax=Paenibacillus sp. YYML68 TaxID=2909250 RepID=UPI00249074F1|nr:hypothetical protein [Paenibacillus sp. YYML68]
MTYQEKKSIVSLVSSIFIFITYCMIKYRQFPEGEPLEYWGSFVLVLTVVSIGAHIVISIVFTIFFRVTTGEKEPHFADEMDKHIELKAFRNSFFIFILGFLISMGSLVMQENINLMFMILIVSGFISDIAGSLSRLYHYRSGV